VGLIASLTRKFSALGSEDKKAVELAINDLNAANVVAIIGPVFSNSALATSLSPSATR